MAFNPSQALQLIEKSRMEWEVGAYKTSNLALYEVLAQCLRLASDLPANLAKQRTAALEAFYKERGLRYKKETPLLTRIVRAVFGNIDRRRVSTYSLVLRESQKQKVFAQNLATWIEEMGGVQEIRLSQSASFVSPAQKAEVAKADFSMLCDLGVAKSEALAELASPDFIGDTCVLLAEQQADGTFAIRALLRSEGVVNAAFTQLYAKQKDGTAQQRKDTNAANDANAMSVAA